MMSIRSTSSHRNGFTLVETLVAIAILMIAIVGPYYSIQQAIVTSYAARDQLIASQLAQEAEEYIYFTRDNAYLGSSDWNAWLSSLSACTGTYGCVVDPGLNTVASCSSSGCPALKQNSNNGLYTQTGSYPTTRFTRTVKMTPINVNEEAVTVTVNWITEHRSYTVTTVDDLYNWL